MSAAVQKNHSRPRLIPEPSTIYYRTHYNGDSGIYVLRQHCCQGATVYNIFKIGCADVLGNRFDNYREPQTIVHFSKTMYPRAAEKIVKMILAPSNIHGSETMLAPIYVIVAAFELAVRIVNDAVSSLGHDALLQVHRAYGNNLKDFVAANMRGENPQLIDSPQDTPLDEADIKRREKQRLLESRRRERVEKRARGEAELVAKQKAALVAKRKRQEELEEVKRSKQEAKQKAALVAKRKRQEELEEALNEAKRSKQEAKQKADAVVADAKSADALCLDRYLHECCDLEDYRTDVGDAKVHAFTPFKALWEMYQGWGEGQEGGVVFNKKSFGRALTPIVGEPISKRLNKKREPPVAWMHWTQAHHDNPQKVAKGRLGIRFKTCGGKDGGDQAKSTRGRRKADLG